MSTRSVNLSLLLLMSLALVSGTLTLLVGQPGGRWLFWLHRIASIAIVALLFWKLRIVTRSFRKRGATPATALSSLFGLLALGALASGVLWATTGFPGLRVPVLGSLTGLGIHIAVSVAIIPLLLWHAIVRWPLVRGRVVDFTGRRATFRYVGLSTAGLLGWQAAERGAALAKLSGGDRRFTGSREAGSFTGNGFPRTNWFSDPMQDIGSDDWSLRIHGSVERDATLTFADLASYPPSTIRATLDCTGGWFTTQDWSGVRLDRLLAAASPTDDARSIVVHSATGYTRRFPLGEADRLLLATHVGGDPLTRGHGHPVRLVAPDYRGFHWVKWVVALEVSDAPEWWQSPLPLQ